MARWIVLTIALALCGIGCSQPSRYATDHHNAEPTTWSLCRNVQGGDVFWEAEIRRGLHWHPGQPAPIILGVHGGYDGNEWHLFPDVGDHYPVKWAAMALKGLFPRNPIVITACNERGVMLGVPGVYYARRVVRSFPYTAIFDDDPGASADRWEHFGTDEHPGPLAK